MNSATDTSDRELPTDVRDAFASAAMTALQELALFEVPPEVMVAEAPVYLPGEFVSATIQLIRPQPGRLILVVPVEVATKLAAKYLPEGTELTAELVDDFSGELTNLIAGQAKTVLKGTDFHYTLSAPAVTRSSSRDVTPQLVIEIPEAGQILVCIELPPCPGA